MQKIDRRKIEAMCVVPGSSVRETMQVIDQGRIATAFVVEPKTKAFLGLITDGDIRRAMLEQGIGLDAKIEAVKRPKATTASVDLPSQELSKLFSETIRLIPILDSQQRIIDIALYDQRVHLPVAEPLLGEKELAYVSDCIVSNWVSSTGKYVRQFESLFADYCGRDYALATSNGTVALHLALLALGIGSGDEVIVPSLTFIATANVVTYTGAKPVFVDSQSQTWNIDPELIKQSITPKTKAIIVVHLYGHPADMDPILKIARSHNLAVIEDAAQAHGAEYKGKKVGSFGDISAFSFFGNKVITTGEGGMLVTDNFKLQERIKLLRDHGMSTSRRYWHTVLGYNYRLTNIQAAIGVAQMEKIDSIVQAKINIANLYQERLSKIKGVSLPPKAAWAKNIYWLYSILIEEEFGLTRDELIEKLRLMSIDSRILFPPVHRQPIYNTGQDLKVAQELALKGLSLPSSAGLQAQEVDRVCWAISGIQERIKDRVN